jgi:hypothetical protein
MTTDLVQRSSGLFIQKAAPKPRRIVQFVQTEFDITALADDGTLWSGRNQPFPIDQDPTIKELKWVWSQIPRLPDADG